MIEHEAGFVEIRSVDGRLLFLYDPVRELIQIKSKGKIRPETVDLLAIKLELAAARREGELTTSDQ